MLHPAPNPSDNDAFFPIGNVSGTYVPFSNPEGFGICIQGDPVAPAPEPSTIVLMGLGLVGLVGMGKKKIMG
jgi:hypothetical protein